MRNMVARDAHCLAAPGISDRHKTQDDFTETNRTNIAMFDGVTILTMAFNLAVHRLMAVKIFLAAFTILKHEKWNFKRISDGLG